LPYAVVIFPPLIGKPIVNPHHLVLKAMLPATPTHQ
jgi:hypothetical protein